MDHSDMKEQLHLYHDGELSASGRAAVEKHLESCAECRARLERFRSLSRALSAGQLPASSEFFVDRVMARVRESRVTARPRIQWVPIRIFAPLTAVAAMLLLTIVPAQGPASEWLAGNDGMSRWFFSGESVQADDVLEYVVDRS